MLQASAKLKRTGGSQVCMKLKDHKETSVYMDKIRISTDSSQCSIAVSTYPYCCPYSLECNSSDGPSFFCPLLQNPIQPFQVCHDGFIPLPQGG